MNNETNKRRSIRLPGFDYSLPGAYFVTICSDQKKCIFGSITDYSMHPNNTGFIVTSCWNRLGEDYPFVSLDSWVLMPNHFHGVLWLNDNNSSKKPLWQIVAAFKSVSTAQVRKVANDSRLKLWQRSFFEHVVRDENELFRIREYIDNNPAQWAVDCENPVVSRARATRPYSYLGD